MSATTVGRQTRPQEQRSKRVNEYMELEGNLPSLFAFTLRI